MQLPKSRSAEDILKGFYYQFDATISKILSQTNPNTIITIEGIEDVDVKNNDGTTAIQIKYQEKTKATDSVLRKPIQLMLKHYIDSGYTDNYLYMLYGHYKNNNLVNTDFNLIRIKTMMIYTESGQSQNFIQEFCISDSQITGFLKKFKFTTGKSFEEHQKNTLSQIKKIFNAKDTEAEYFYNNALRTISDLAIQKDIKKRRITKQQFLDKVGSKEILFNIWYIKLKGLDNYYKLVHNKYFESSVNILNFPRVFIINTEQFDIEVLISTVYNLEKKFYKKVNKSINYGPPYLFFNKISSKSLINLKQRIMCDGKYLHDGHCFKGSQFNISEIMKPSTIDNQISIKIINTENELIELVEKIPGTKYVYQFYKYNIKPIKSIDTINIEIEQLNDISKII